MEPTSLPLQAAAVIPAAGRARRFGKGENKIWAQVAGRAVLEWTLSAFDAHPAITSIVVVAGAEELEAVRTACAPFSKIIAVVAGGETRTESVRNGLDALPADTKIVLVHDAARPLITPEVITRIIEATARVGAAVPGLPLSDTVKRVDSAGLVRATISRSEIIQGETLSGLTAVQTPQGAQVALLRTAYAAYDFSRSEPTDEASLLEAHGLSVAVVPGDPTNIKITRPEDVALAERLLEGRGKREEGRVKNHGEHRETRGESPLTTEDTERYGEKREENSPQRHRDTEREENPRNSELKNPTTDTRYPIPEVRTGFGYDVHAFATPEAGRKLFIGGVEIPHDRGLEGHSDADVLLHAVCDALLGAASLGDIGILFPNTDTAYKNIDSRRLLAVVAERVQEAGWQVVNIDAAVVAEAPKLMPHRAAMQQAMAECLGIEPSRISVKATTSEKMGFVGRKEGMACWAVATLRSLSNV